MTTSTFEAVPLLDSLADNITCSICLEIYTEPVELECKHAYCRECANKLLTSQQAISCPECRFEMKLTGRLPTDFKIQRLVDLYNQQVAAIGRAATKPQVAGALDGLTSQCGLCNNVPVLSYCHQCCRSLCEQCHNSHPNIPQCCEHVRALMSQLVKETRGKLEEVLHNLLSQEKVLVQNADTQLNQLAQSQEETLQLMDEACRATQEAVQKFYNQNKRQFLSHIVDQQIECKQAYNKLKVDLAQEIAEVQELDKVSDVEILKQQHSVHTFIAMDKLPQFKPLLTISNTDSYLKAWQPEFALKITASDSLAVQPPLGDCHASCVLAHMFSLADIPCINTTTMYKDNVIVVLSHQAVYVIDEAGRVLNTINIPIYTQLVGLVLLGLDRVVVADARQLYVVDSARHIGEPLPRQQTAKGLKPLHESLMCLTEDGNCAPVRFHAMEYRVVTEGLKLQKDTALHYEYNPDHQYGGFCMADNAAMWLLVLAHITEGKFIQFDKSGQVLSSLSLSTNHIQLPGCHSLCSHCWHITSSALKCELCDQPLEESELSLTLESGIRVLELITIGDYVVIVTRLSLYISTTKTPHFQVYALRLENYQLLDCHSVCKFTNDKLILIGRPLQWGIAGEPFHVYHLDLAKLFKLPLNDVS